MENSFTVFTVDVADVPPEQLAAAEEAGLRYVMNEEPGFARCTSVRLAYCGGEALSADIAEKVRARLGMRRTSWRMGPGASTGS